MNDDDAGRRKVTKHLAGQIQARWNNTEVVKLHADHKVAKSNMKVSCPLLLADKLLALSTSSSLLII